MAQYAAVKHGIKAIGYSSAALGYGALVDLDSTTRLWDANWVKQHIQHFFISGDPICDPFLWKSGSNFRKKFFLTNLGSRHIIPAQSKTYDSYLARHSYAEQHILKFIEQKITKNLA